MMLETGWLAAWAVAGSASGGVATCSVSCLVARPFGQTFAWGTTRSVAWNQALPTVISRNSAWYNGKVWANVINVISGYWTASS